MTTHKKTETDNRYLSGTFSKISIINMLKKVDDYEFQQSNPFKNQIEILQNSKLPETKNTIDSTLDTAKTRTENKKTGANFQTKAQR